MLKYFYLGFYGCLLLLLSGCQAISLTQPHIPVSTANVSSIDSYIVVGLNGDLVVKMALENEMVNLLRQQGVHATAGWEEHSIQFTADTTFSKNFCRKMRDKGYQAALSLNIVEMKENIRYVDEPLMQEPLMYPVPYKSNLMEIYWQIQGKGGIKSVNVSIQANIYNLETGQLLWASQTSITDPESVNMLARLHAQTLYEKLSSRSAKN